MAELIHTHKGTVYAQRNGVLIPVNTDGLVGYWPMTQGSGGTLYDESKTGNDGTIYGPVWTNTANGKALDFDGIDDYIDIAETGIPSGASGETMTLSTWVNPSIVDVTEEQNVVGIQNEWQFRLGSEDTGAQPDGSLWFRTFGGNNNGTPEALSANEWAHIVFVWNVGSNLSTYLNGNMIEDQISFLDTSSDTGNNFQLARDLGNSNERFFDGKIDEVRIYDRALSAQEITNIYEKTRGLYGV